MKMLILVQNSFQKLILEASLSLCKINKGITPRTVYKLYRKRPKENKGSWGMFNGDVNINFNSNFIHK